MERNSNHLVIKITLVVLLCLPILLSSCSNSHSYAPVIDVRASTNTLRAGVYRVKAGDTLYSIAWAYGLDYRTLAKVNHLLPPFDIFPGQKIYMRRVVYLPSRRQRHKNSQRPQPVYRAVRWRWPARGRIKSRFSARLPGNQGLDIAGHYGEPVRAAASGLVVYSGSGVRGYGNLIIIKHNNSFLSAYAFNKTNLVKRGVYVRRGQSIATMGRNNAGSVLLHFEIRYNGKPVNPMAYLAKN